MCAKSFSKNLLNWYETNKRILPWNQTDDPYKIWISEIILQQTRVAQGLDYYERLLKKYPDIKMLAQSSEDELLGQWQGLGYYSRARNLLKTAKIVATEFQGKMPETYEEIIKLPGIGPYTAAAILSMAFNQKYIALDGNLFRVLSRINAVHADVTKTNERKLFISESDKYISEKYPGDWNRAMMDIGAKICLPQTPKCDECPINNYCQAHKFEQVNEYPKAKKKIKRKKRYFNYYVIIKENKVLLHKRSEKDIWANMYEFPLIEVSIDDFKKKGVGDLIKSEKRILTHQEININLIKLKNFDKHKEQINMKEHLWCPVEKLSAMPFPRTLQLFIRESPIFELRKKT